jgi:glutamate-1-semialdehyde 2,1-aminomutase
VRSGHAVGGEPFLQTRGAGAYAFDADGRRYIDYVMAYGPLLLGHAHPAVSTGLDEIAARGMVFGSTTPDEVVLAERIRAQLPAMERIRFTTTGSEAVMSAIRVARAFTGRDAVLKFSGNYHGHFDLALLDAGASAHTESARHSGIPSAITRDLYVARYNDLAGVDGFLAQAGARLAAIVVEPIVGNMGLVLPAAGFLAGLQARAQACGALLIFDEIITWLRLGLGGAQARVGVTPDLTTVGKIIGGGAPLAAFGGRAEVMRVLAPEGPCFTGGTHAGNPFAAALALRVLDWIESHPGCYADMDRLAKRLAAGIRLMLGSLGLDYAVVQLESIVDFKFRAGRATRDYDDARRADADVFAAYYHALRRRGVLLAPSQNEVMFLSTEHTADDVDRTIVAIEEALRELRTEGKL